MNYDDIELQGLLHTLVPELQEGLSKLPDKERVDELLDQIRQLTSNDNVKTFLDESGIPNMTHVVANAANSLDDSITKIRKTVHITFAAGLVYFSFAYVKSRKRKDLIVLICYVGIMINLTDFATFQEMYSVMLSPIANVFSFKEPDPITTQSRDTSMLYDTMILSWLSYVGFQSEKEFKLKERVKEFSDILRLRSSLPEFIDAIHDMLALLYNEYIAKAFDLKKMGLSSFEDPSLVEFDKNVEELVSAKARGDFSMSIGNRAKIQYLLDKSKELYRSIPPGREFNNQRSLFSKTVESLTKIKREFDHANVHLNGFRPEAVGVLFRGGPGSHKSTIMNTLSSSLAAAILDEKDYEDYLQNPNAYEHNRQHETVYMDGYSPKTITVFFDDLGQSRDSTGNPDSEWMNIIRFINSFECMGHAASMDLKGELRVRPKFVLATTNMMKLRSNSINTIGAVNRRFVVNVIAAPILKYCVPGSSGLHDRKFDYDNLPKTTVDDVEVSNVTMDLFEFYPCDENGEIAGKAISYTALVDLTIAEYKKREAWAKLHISNFQKEASIARGRYTYDLQMQSGSSSIVGQFRDMFMCDIQTQSTEVKYHEQSVINRSSDALALAKEIGEGVLPYTDVYINVRSNLSIITDETKMSVNNFFGTYRSYNPYVVGEKLRQFIDDVDCTWALSSDDLLLLLYQHDVDKFKRFVLFHDNIYDNWDYSIDSEIFKVSIVCEVKEVRSFKSIVTSYVDSGCAKMRYVRDWIISFDRTMLIKATAVLTILSTLYTLFFKEDEEKISDAQVDYGVFQKKNAHQQNRSLRTMKQQMLSGRSRTQPQAIDISGEQIIKSLDKSNVVTIYMDVGDSVFKLLGYGILLKKNFVLVPLHFIDTVINACQEDDKRYGNIVRLLPSNCTNPSDTVYGQCTLQEFVENSSGEGFEDYHVALIKIHTRDCKDITKRSFVTESSMDTYMNFFDITVSMPARGFMASSRAYKQDINVRGHADGNYYMRHCVRYFADTNAGDCGAPLYIRKSRLQGHRILGFHVAGSRHANDECAFSTIITQELIEALLKQVEDGAISDVVELDEVEIQSVPLAVVGKYNVLGKVSEVHSPYGVTSIRPSPLNRISNKSEEAIVSQHRPAMLNVKGDIDPYAIALSNYCVNTCTVDLYFVMIAKEDFRAKLFSSVNKVEKNLLTYEEALWGSEYEEHLEAIKSSSSAGYPMKFKKHNLKAQLFAKDMIRTKENPFFGELVSLCESVVQDAKKGVRRLWIMTDNLKDERRTVEKVLQGKTRLFNGCPLIYLVVFRRYFGKFAQFVHMNSIHNGMVTTINPYSRRWDEIATELKNRSTERDPPACDADFSKYDGSMITDFANVILDIINEWYNDGNDLVRKTLWLEITNSRHIVNNVIYEWYSSLPSGNPLTLIINCMNNQLIHRYAWYKNVSRTELFDKHVTLFVTGDDVIMAVSDEMKDKFNGVTVMAMMKEIGYIYTSSDKTSSVVPWKKLSEVTFLKRSFRYDKVLHRYIACLDINSVCEIPLWTKKGDYYAVAESNVKDFLNELSLHDASTWDKYSKRYISAVEVFMPECNLEGTLHMSKRQRMDLILGQE